jgi:HEAT repeat protein
MYLVLGNLIILNFLSLESLLSAISNVGFPITIALLLFYIHTHKLEKVADTSAQCIADRKEEFHKLIHKLKEVEKEVQTLQTYILKILKK